MFIVSTYFRSEHSLALTCNAHPVFRLCHDGKWISEFRADETCYGPNERDAVVCMRSTRKHHEDEAIRSVINVPVRRLQGDRQVLYVTGTVRAPMTKQNLSICLDRGISVSVEAKRPGSMVLTFRDKRYKNVVKALEEGTKGITGLSPLPEYIATIHDDNPDGDNQWLSAWQTSFVPSQSLT